MPGFLNDIVESKFGQTVIGAVQGFGRRISSNGAIQLTGKNMLDEDVSMINDMYKHFSGGDAAVGIADRFFDNHKMSINEAFLKYSKGIEGDFSTDASKAEYLRSMGKTFFNGDVQFKKHSDTIRYSNELRGNGNKVGAGGWTKSAINYYGLQDLKASKTLGWNKETMLTAGARYGTTAAAIGAVGVVGDGIMGGYGD